MNASVTLRDGSGNVKKEVQVRVTTTEDLEGLNRRTCHEADATFVGMSDAKDVTLAISALERVRDALNDTAEHLPLSASGQPQD